jgi:hypothetical protein
MNVSLYLVGSLELFIFACECLIFICNFRVRCRVRVTRRVEFTRAGAGMEAFSYPCAVAGNPTGTTWRVRVRVRVRVATTRRVRTRCHLDSPGNRVWFLDDYKDFHLSNEWPSSLSSDTSSMANPRPFSPLPMISWRGFLGNAGAAWLFPEN